eukprot:494239_1
MDSTDDERDIKHVRNNSVSAMRANRKNSMKTMRKTSNARIHSKTKSSYKIPNAKMIHSKSTYKINKRPMDDSSDDEKYDQLYDGNVYKAKILIKNDKYAFNNVIATEDGSHIIAASRKVHCWKWSGFTNNKSKSQNSSNDSHLEKGPRIADSDFEHIECVQVQNELMCVSRKGKKKVKIFNVANGKKALEKKFKGPVGKVQFLFDNQHCVVCVQKTGGGDVKNADKNNKVKLTYKRPSMYVWNYNA